MARAGRKKETTGTDKGEDEYCIQLATLQKIRSIAGGYELNLPQICVVGDQSSGKSALLGEITGINFPVNVGMCTKAPIVVECKRQEGESETYEVMQNDCSYKAVAKVEELAHEITNIQEEALLRENVKISKNEIRVRVRGPDQVDLIVVDLPGIINHGEGEREARQLIQKYIRIEQTLILLVSEGKQDVRKRASRSACAYPCVYRMSCARPSQWLLRLMKMAAARCVFSRSATRSIPTRQWSG